MTQQDYNTSPDSVNTQEHLLAESPRTHFSMVPNCVFHLGLSSAALHLYFYYRSIGACFKSQVTIEKETGISTRNLRNLNMELCRPLQGVFREKGLIKIIARKKKDGSKDSNLILVEDIWQENDLFFKERLQSAKSAGGSESKKDYNRQNLPEGPAKSADRIILPEQDSVVVDAREDAQERELSGPVTEPAKSEQITIRDFKGGSSLLTRSDVFRLGVANAWTPAEIQAAWQTIASYQGPIRSWAKYAEGVVATLRVNDDVYHAKTSAAKEAAAERKKRVLDKHQEKKKSRKPVDRSTWIV